MMRQTDLFDVNRYPNGPGARRSVPTSQAAAASMRPHVTALQKRILDFLEGCGAEGAIYTAIVDGTKLSAATVTGRMVELANAKRVTIATFTRATPSGRQAKVYVFVPEGKS